jgi:hypothetical protein
MIRASEYFAVLSSSSSDAPLKSRVLYRIVFTMLEKGVRRPLSDHEREPGHFSLFMPCDVTVEPKTMAVIDMSVAVKLPAGWGGSIRLKPHLLARYTQSRVLSQRVGEHIFAAAAAAGADLALLFQTVAGCTR